MTSMILNSSLTSPNKYWEYWAVRDSDPREVTAQSVSGPFVVVRETVVGSGVSQER